MTEEYRRVQGRNLAAPLGLSPFHATRRGTAASATADRRGTVRRRDRGRRHTNIERRTVSVTRSRLAVDDHRCRRRLSAAPRRATPLATLARSRAIRRDCHDFRDASPRPALPHSVEFGTTTASRDRHACQGTSSRRHCSAPCSLLSSPAAPPIRSRTAATLRAPRAAAPRRRRLWRRLDARRARPSPAARSSHLATPWRRSTSATTSGCWGDSHRNARTRCGTRPTA